jgi:hypothetical protein
MKRLVALCFINSKTKCVGIKMSEHAYALALKIFEIRDAWFGNFINIAIAILRALI